jgi:hypothetical protein
LQPSFILQESFTKFGKKFSAVKYIADFRVVYPDQSIAVVDVKGQITADFAIKRKWFEHKFLDLPLSLIKYSKMDGGWIELDDYDRLKKERKKSKTKNKSKK